MSQRYMLDTNVVSHIMQGRDAALLARLTQLPVGQVVLSSVTLAELEYGLHRKGQPVRLMRISVIVDTCFRLIVDGVSEPSWTRRGCAQASI